MDSQEWVTVYTLNDPILAEIIKNSLVADGILCNLEGMNEATQVGLVPLAIKVQVPARDAELAQRLVRQHEQHEPIGNA